MSNKKDICLTSVILCGALQYLVLVKAAWSGFLVSHEKKVMGIDDDQYYLLLGEFYTLLKCHNLNLKCVCFLLIFSTDDFLFGVCFYWLGHPATLPFDYLKYIIYRRKIQIN